MKEHHELERLKEDNLKRQADKLASEAEKHDNFMAKLREDKQIEIKDRYEHTLQTINERKKERNIYLSANTPESKKLKATPLYKKNEDLYKKAKIEKEL